MYTFVLHSISRQPTMGFISRIVVIFWILWSGVYGAHSDDNPCSANCRKGCDVATGYCLHCHNGWYSDKCDLSCPKNCEVCNKTNGSCIHCEHRWYGDLCTIPCENDCLSCDKSTGHCLKCQATFWGESCEKKCKGNCQTCNIDTGECRSCIEGYYGENCTDICGNCYKNTCGRLSGECVYECEDGWYGSMCMKKCIANCSICSDDSTCIACKDGLAGELCDLECPAVCQSCSRDKESNILKCTRCRDGLSLPEKDCTCTNSKCITFAKEIDSVSTTCEECQNGTFLYQGTCCPCVHCLGGIETCDNKHGCIQGCKPGFYPKYSGCDKKCDIEHCVMCEPTRHNGKMCIHCDNGWYPSSEGCKSCNLNCAGPGNMCDNETGACLHGCKEGWHSIYCDSLCNDSCISCDNVNGICKMCDLGLWGKQCQYNCPKNCKLCNILNGKCDICNGGYIGPNCTKACVNCKHEQCIPETGLCDFGCNEGWYGNTCDNKCLDNCDECDDSESCIICSSGWSGTKCETKCPDSCNGCSVNATTNQLSCKECKEPYLVPSKSCSCTNTKCVRYVQNLHTTTCELCDDHWFRYLGTCCPCSECNWSPTKCKAIGKCLDGCLPEYLPSFSGCSTDCSLDKCNWCEIAADLSETCIGCKEGYFPVDGICKPCSDRCASGRYTECDNITGVCLNGCRKGWHKSHCDSKCTIHCKECNETMGICHSCKNGYWGDNCKQPCHGHCRKCGHDASDCIVIDGHHIESHTCDKISGNCTNGCVEGWYGSSCDTKCKRCNKGHCEQDTGYCLSGCLEGWKSKRCDVRATDDSMPKLTPIIGGAVGGGILLIILIIVFICFARKQKFSSSLRVHRQPKNMNGTLRT